jgi:protein TonB
VAPPAPAPVTPPRSEAAHLNNPPPNYPLAAQRRGDHGTVQLRLIVTAEGLAKNVVVEQSSGHRALDEAAVAAVRNWRFVPARQGGLAIDWPYTQSIHFKPPG